MRFDIYVKIRIYRCYHNGISIEQPMDPIECNHENCSIGKEASLKISSMVISVLMTFVLMSCASTPYAPDSRQEQAALEKRTPRFSEFVEALEYLGNQLNKEVYYLTQSSGFSAVSSGGESQPLTPEEQTQKNAEDAMAELESEIRF